MIRLDSVTFPSPISENGHRLFDLYNLISIFAIVVFIFVEALILWTVIRYRRRHHDEMPRQVHGNTALEIVWVVVPSIIIGIIAFLSAVELNRDFNAANFPAAEVNVNVIGRQFLWQYEYPDASVSTGRFTVPQGRVVKLSFTSPDVIHSWWVPELTGKTDAVPGYFNYSWFRAEKIGTFQGECAEFCGINHAEMRIAVNVVSQADYDKWIAECQAGKNNDCRPTKK